MEEKLEIDELKEIGMTLNEYQSKCHETRNFDETKKFVYPVLGLAGESGEVCDKLKKVIRDKNGKITNEVKKEIALELGDVLWYVAEAAHDFGYTLEQIATMNIFKLQSRKERNKIHGEGDHR